MGSTNLHFRSRHRCQRVWGCTTIHRRLRPWNQAQKLPHILRGRLQVCDSQISAIPDSFRIINAITFAE